MNEQSPLVFVCSTRKEQSFDWPAAHARFEILYTTIPDVVLASVRRSDGPGSREINAVIFDRSIGAKSFLAFLSEVASAFSGDVLLVCDDGCAILSTVSPRNGRFIYRLDEDELRLYAFARFGIKRPVSSVGHYEYPVSMTA